MEQRETSLCQHINLCVTVSILNTGCSSGLEVQFWTCSTYSSKTDTVKLEKSQTSLTKITNEMQQFVGNNSS